MNEEDSKEILETDNHNLQAINSNRTSSFISPITNMNIDNVNNYQNEYTKPELDQMSYYSNNSLNPDMSQDDIEASSIGASALLMLSRDGWEPDGSVRTIRTRARAQTEGEYHQRQEQEHEQVKEQLREQRRESQISNTICRKSSVASAITLGSYMSVISSIDEQNEEEGMEVVGESTTIKLSPPTASPMLLLPGFINSGNMNDNQRSNLAHTLTPNSDSNVDRLGTRITPISSPIPILARQKTPDLDKYHISDNGTGNVPPIDAIPSHPSSHTYNTERITLLTQHQIEFQHDDDGESVASTVSSTSIYNSKPIKERQTSRSKVKPKTKNSEVSSNINVTTISNIRKRKRLLRSDISRVTHLTMEDAAKHLKIGVSTFKKKKIALGFRKWPYRQVQTLYKHLDTLKMQLFTLESSFVSNNGDIDKYLKISRKNISSGSSNKCSNNGSNSNGSGRSSNDSLNDETSAVMAQIIPEGIIARSGRCTTPCSTSFYPTPTPTPTPTSTPATITTPNLTTTAPPPSTTTTSIASTTNSPYNGCLDISDEVGDSTLLLNKWTNIIDIRHKICAVMQAILDISVSGEQVNATKVVNLIESGCYFQSDNPDTDDNDANSYMIPEDATVTERLELTMLRPRYLPWQPLSSNTTTNATNATNATTNTANGSNSNSNSKSDSDSDSVIPPSRLCAISTPEEDEIFIKKFDAWRKTLVPTTCSMPSSSSTPKPASSDAIKNAPIRKDALVATGTRTETSVSSGDQCSTNRTNPTLVIPSFDSLPVLKRRLRRNGHCHIFEVQTMREPGLYKSSRNNDISRIPDTYEFSDVGTVFGVDINARIN